MSIHIFPDSRDNLVRRNREPVLGLLDESISIKLEKVPEEVKKIIDSNYTNPNNIIIINPLKLKLLLIDYIIYNLSTNGISTGNPNITLGINYLTELLFQMFLFKGDDIKIIINQPYFTYWMDKGFPKRAGDASVYSYLFRDFSKKEINRNDYIGFAKAGYTEWSGNIYFGNAIGEILPSIGGMMTNNDFLSRGKIRLIKI